MKRLSLSLTILTAMLMVLGSCGTDKMAHISEDYELFGTWENPEYGEATFWAPKMVYYPNGHADFFDSLSDPKVTGTGEVTITDKWVDSDGIVWFTYTLKLDGPGLAYCLVKLSDEGKTYEGSVTNIDYPKTVDPANEYSSPNYHVYYRK